jgi:hypothetical protein
VYPGLRTRVFPLSPFPGSVAGAAGRCFAVLIHGPQTKNKKTDERPVNGWKGFKSRPAGHLRDGRPGCGLPRYPSVTGLICRLVCCRNSSSCGAVRVLVQRVHCNLSVARADWRDAQQQAQRLEHQQPAASALEQDPRAHRAIPDESCDAQRCYGMEAFPGHLEGWRIVR